jgi:nitroreductase
MTALTANVMAEIQEALTHAATVAGLAPSIHNTQPWHWKVRPAALELWTVPDRQLPITDPDGRMAAMSCGAALYLAQADLAAAGWQSTVLIAPDPSHPDHLAHLTLSGRRSVTVTTAAVRLGVAIRSRRTDRRPVNDVPVKSNDLLAITLAVQSENCYLHELSRDQVIELAAELSYAQHVEVTDPAWRSELTAWTGGPGPVGVPDDVVPTEQPQTTVPGRDFGHPGTLPISSDHDNAATYAMIYGRADDLTGWVAAGQAMAAAWLTATVLGVSVLPLSAVIEVEATRIRLGRMLVDGCHPYLVLRLGHHDPMANDPGPTPRLPADQVIETLVD